MKKWTKMLWKLKVLGKTRRTYIEMGVEVKFKKINEEIKEWSNKKMVRY